MTDDMNLQEFQGGILNGITVGWGSLVFIFSSDVQIMAQCVFELTSSEGVKVGHGESPESSPVLFDCLNQRIVKSGMRDGSIMFLEFDDGKVLSFIPDNNGMESYVITTSSGIFPVMLS